MNPFLSRALRCLLVLALVGAPLLHAADEAVVVHQAQGEFQDYRDRVVFAIEEKGLSIAHTSKVGSMLNRTAKDLGIARQTYGEAEVIEFCSASLSREVTDADPRFVAYCPYSITVYTLTASPGTVHVAYRRLGAPGASPALADALRKAEALISDIVRSALD